MFVRKTDWLDIYIEESKKNIVIQEKWQYNWLNNPGTTPWTYSQKKNFHKEVDRLIWSKWGSHYTIKTSGSSDFAKRTQNVIFKLEFDVKWVLTDTHWTVDVVKIPPGSFDRSYIIWGLRQIHLDTEDIKLRTVTTGFYQYPIVHEFGHTIGNVPNIHTGAHGDEYDSASAFNADQKSIMNMGGKLRDRHIDYILLELNKMIPNTQFNLFKIK